MPIIANVNRSLRCVDQPPREASVGAVEEGFIPGRLGPFAASGPVAITRKAPSVRRGAPGAVVSSSIASIGALSTYNTRPSRGIRY